MKKADWNFFIVLLLHFIFTNSISQEYPYPPPLNGLPENIRLGGIFDGDDPSEETAFKFAIERINNMNILPRTRFSAVIERISSSDTFTVANKVCNMLAEGIGAIFGPKNFESASHVQSICDGFEVPHIETRWDYSIRKENYLVNLAPHPDTLSRAYADLVETWGWEKYIIIYENREEFFYKLQHLLKLSTPPKRNAILKQLPDGEDFRPFFKKLAKLEIYNFIIDCQTSKVWQILKQAQQVGMMTYRYSYILTSLDLGTLDLDDFKYSDLNLTSFRLIDPQKPEVQTVIQDWNAKHIPSDLSPVGHLYGFDTRRNFNPSTAHSSSETQNEASLKMITTDTALILDAIQVYARALQTLETSQRIEIRPLSCESSEMWQHGYSIINYMKMVQLQGLTGIIQFNNTGFRTDVNLDVVKLTQNGIDKIGTWSSKFVSSKFNWTQKEESLEHIDPNLLDLANRTLTVTTILNAPFCMLTRSEDPLEGNARYEGYSIELVQKLSGKLGFKYIIKIVDDNAYGSYNNKSKTWNGMIREVLDGVADIAVADLTINKDRQAAVAFTMPFMNLGITILFTTPKAKPPSLFSFMSPFSVDVWMYMGLAFFGVSFFLFILGRISPFEWDCPYPCIQKPEYLENQFGINNSIWCTLGSIMQQGSDVAPIAPSTRIINSIWWLVSQD